MKGAEISASIRLSAAQSDLELLFREAVGAPCCLNSASSALRSHQSRLSTCRMASGTVELDPSVNRPLASRLFFASTHRRFQTNVPASSAVVRTRRPRLGLPSQAASCDGPFCGNRTMLRGRSDVHREPSSQNVAWNKPALANLAAKRGALDKWIAVAAPRFRRTFIGCRQGLMADATTSEVSSLDHCAGKGAALRTSSAWRRERN